MTPGERLSGGRLTLGLAPGGRADDYTVTGAETVKAFEDGGVTELYLDATTSDPEQVDRLADVLF